MYKFDERTIYAYNMQDMCKELGISFNYFVQLRTQYRVGKKIYKTTYGWMFTSLDINLFNEILRFPKDMKTLDKQEKVIIMKHENDLEIEKLKTHYEKYGNYDYNKEEVEATEQSQLDTTESIEEVIIEQTPIETTENKFFRALDLLERVSSDKEMYLATLDFLHKAYLIN